MNAEPTGHGATSDVPRGASGGTPGDSGVTGRRRTALVVSCALIVAWWIGFAAWKLTRPEHPLPSSIEALFLRKVLEAAGLAVVVGLLLRASGERFKDLGISVRGLVRSIVFGLGAALVLFIIINVGVNTIVRSLLGGSVDATVRALFQDRSDAPWWIGTAIVGGGFAEELARAFVLTRFERLLGRAGLVSALVVDSTVFGLGHLYQGTSGAVSSAVTGLLFAFVFLRRRRATDSMAAHAWFDILGIAAAYALYGPRG